MKYRIHTSDHMLCFEVRSFEHMLRELCRFSSSRLEVIATEEEVNTYLNTRGGYDEDEGRYS